MKSTHKQMHARILVILALLLPGIQAFCWTPAGTEIRNQSVATYKDLNDQPQISTSNEVINIVAKKYGLEITPDYAVTGDAPFNYTAPPALTQTAAPGSIAYFHYYLKNTGNTPDAYNLIANFQAEDIGESRRAPDTVEVYYDANGNGQVDAGDILLYTRAGAVETPGDPTPLVAQDASIPLIVAVHIPTDAADGHHINTDIDAASIGSDPSDYIDAISNWNQTIISAGTGILTPRQPTSAQPNPAMN
ncbi:MAG: hypothetical protein GX946_02455 [Oligosphaeraceae bacterium]|nr:hypothetical protein [Oligosphaeraceae bacterium]